jgi:hypothetical protein
MLNFPNAEPAQLRKMRAQLLAPQSDPTWHGTVTTLLQMLIDGDLGQHRIASMPALVVDNSNKIVQDEGEDNFST